MHFLMKLRTASVYSCRSIQSPEVAVSLKILHSVRSKQSFSAGMASCGHTLMLLSVAGIWQAIINVCEQQFKWRESFILNNFVREVSR